jgi:hypothetical protein
MTSRERMMTALENGRPDRLPCQVHGWMQYYLDHYLGGINWYRAYEMFGMDYAIYGAPVYEYDEKDCANWQKNRTDLGTDDRGDHLWEETIATPGGKLRHRRRAGSSSSALKPQRTMRAISSRHQTTSSLVTRPIESLRRRLQRMPLLI